MKKLYKGLTAIAFGLSSILAVGVVSSISVANNTIKANADDSITFGPTQIGTGNATYTADNKVTIVGTTCAASYFQVYKSSTLTVSVVENSNIAITKIEMTCTVSGTAKYGPGCFENSTSVGTYSYSDKVGTWAYSAGTSDNIVLTASANQVRITSFTISYISKSSTVTPTSLTIDGDFTKKTYYSTESWDVTGLTTSVNYSNNTSDTASPTYTFNPEYPSTSTTSVEVTATVGELTKTKTITGITVSDPSLYDVVTDVSSLRVGDKFFLAANTTDKGAFVNGTFNSNYLESVKANFDSENLKFGSHGFDELTLGGGDGAWTLSNSKGEIGVASAIKDRLSMAAASLKTWGIDIDSTTGVATISSTNSDLGTLQYNAGTPRFANYPADGQTSIYLVRTSRGTERTLVSISVELKDSSKNWFTGDVVTVSDITCTATYNDGYTQIVYPTLSSNTLVSGANTVVATFCGMTSNVQVNAIDAIAPSISEVSISDLSSKTEEDLTVVKTTGIVTKISSTDYGSLYIADPSDTTKSIYVYNSTADSTKMTLTDSKLGYYTSKMLSGKYFNNACAVGDTITIQCVFTIYNGTKEISGVITNVSSEQTANTFATKFTNTVTCDGGATAPSTSAWSQMKTAYEALSDEEKAKLSSATVSSGTWSLIDRCIVRYDYIINKYGTDTYEDFMSRAESSGAAVIKSAFEDNSTVTSIVTVAAIGSITLVGGLTLSRKRKEF